MGTATSRLAALGLAVLFATAAAGCGSIKHSSQSTAGAPQTTMGAARSTTAASSFAWLHPAPAPAGWHTARISTGAAVSYPPGWAPIHGDPGTASAALLGSDHQYLGYLNITPRQGAETLDNWARFRVDHNADEGDRGIQTLAATTKRRFGDEYVSCVKDAYATGTGMRYVELACLVARSRGNVVVVGAGPPQSWPRVSPLIEQAITSTTA
jgi:hypothetical protein